MKVFYLILLEGCVVWMKGPFVFLCPEISRSNALTLMSWMQDEELTQFLTDTQDVSKDIENVLNRVQLPVLTHFFNQNGRFFMAYKENNEAVGFVRLVQKGNQTEIVIAIGEKSNWGQKLGPCTIRESLKVAFFEMRSEKLIAKIDKRNTRSIKAFIGEGFKSEDLNSDIHSFSMTMEDYISSIKEGASVSNAIYITEFDKGRLQKLIAEEVFSTAKEEHIFKNLKKELDKAIVVPPQELPENIISMNSKAVIDLDGEEMEVALVFPQESDWESNKLSIFSPIGTALIGYSEGDKVEWELPTGEKAEIQIKKIIYQPEAAGDLSL